MAHDDLDLIEKPFRERQKQIDDLERQGRDVAAIGDLRAKLDRDRTEAYARLTPWQTTLVARHARRPYTLDLVALLAPDWAEIAGDRLFGDDPAIVAGMATFAGRQAMIVGHQKGRDTKEKLHRNFGMPRPEGYRKALRAMRLAEKFGRPILTFIDTPGAFPGLDAEERGQAEAIAMNLREMAEVRVPIVATITGEGGSGGALALGVADRVLMLEHAIYSVISPEGCAAILWKDGGRARDAAEALRMTAPDLKALGVVDEIVEEPVGGAHADWEKTARLLSPRLEQAIAEVVAISDQERLEQRYRKYRAMGALA
ncbi:MAG: acetyl-CoA carboxylase carboxyltransferase subunit alpha [Acidobacteriota bacterium]